MIRPKTESIQEVLFFTADSNIMKHRVSIQHQRHNVPIKFHQKLSSGSQAETTAMQI
jgi:hypothetical protein